MDNLSHPQCLKTDQILSLFDKDKARILKMIENSEQGVFFTKDENCMYNLGNYGECNHKKYACSCCENIRKIIDFRHSCINNCFKIESGKYKGKEFVFKKEKYAPIFLTDKNNIILDDVTNNIVLSWLVKGALPCIASYQCRENLYSLYPVSKKLNEVCYKPMEVVKTLFKFLNNKFFHGNPTVDSLCWNGDSLCMTNFQNSSVMYKGKKIYNGNIFIQAIIENKPLKIRRKNYLVWTDEKRDRIPTFSVEGPISDIFIGFRHEGENFPDLSAFSAYCFLVSLMMENKDDPDMKKLCKNIWPPLDLKKVNSRMENSNNNTYDIIKIIEGLNLREDIIEYINKF